MKTSGRNIDTLYSRITRKCQRVLGDILREIEYARQSTDCKVWLVGGVVRDIVCHCEPQAKQSHTSKEIASAFKEGLAMTPGGTGLPRPHTRHRNDNNDNVDIDIVVCGDWRKFTSLLAKKFGAKSIFFPQFLGGHFTIQTGKNKYEVNITHTRKESYIKSGSLPRVVPTTLEEDLGRRDFAMNAIAVSLNPENYLQIIDVYDGIEDILHKCIRVLKKNSFREDPTRIIRAIRYEVRLGFRMTQDTLAQMKNAINAGCIARIPGERLRDELILNLKEHAVYEGILRLFKYGVFSSVWPELTLTTVKKRYIQRIITRWESLRPLDLSVPVERRLKPAATGLFVERWLCLLIAVCWGASSNSSREKSLLLKREITGHLGLNKRQSQALINSEVQIRKAQNIICKKDTNTSAITTALDCCDEYALAMMLLIATSRRVSGRIIRYVNDWKKRKPLLNGNDLKKIGLKPGPKFQKILAELRLAQIDGKISTRQQAKQFVKRPR